MTAQAFEIGQKVVYRGRTYTFPGEVCGITDDGQVIVRATIPPYAGMKHIYGPAQLEPWDSAQIAYDPVTIYRAAEIAQRFAYGPSTDPRFVSMRTKIATAIRSLTGEGR